MATTPAASTSKKLPARELGYMQPGDDVLVALGTEPEADSSTQTLSPAQVAASMTEPATFSRAWWQLWLDRLGLSR
ncbi:MAG: hypothetical protein R2856_25615 [Caldilineaceae bacterium]